MPRCSPVEPMDRVEIITFGCRLNAAESEVMRRLADGARLGNAVIVNTCAVTAEAERQARQVLRRSAAAQRRPQQYDSAGRQLRMHRSVLLEQLQDDQAAQAMPDQVQRLRVNGA